MKIASFKKRGWINANTDRRPMTDDWVLVTANDRGYRYVTICQYNDPDGWFVDEDTEILAWMPLPEVYQR